MLKLNEKMFQENIHHCIKNVTKFLNAYRLRTEMFNMKFFIVKAIKQEISLFKNIWFTFIKRTIL